MKKQFFYAAFAMAMMASCTSEENLPVEPTPEEDKVAIQLGVDFPSITASSRSTGPVGDVAGVNNQWNGQRLFIAMVDEKGALAVEDKTVSNSPNVLTPTLYEYRAPKFVTPTYDGEGNITNQAQISNKGNIRIYNSYDPTNQNGELKHVYYPVSDTYDFYGWHVDGDETGSNKGANGTVTITAATENTPAVATVSDIVIDGNRDIMGARTKAYTDANYGNLYNSNLNDWIFSARSARSDVHPILEFKHQLARLKFFVRAGSPETSAKVWNATANNGQGGWQDRSITNGTHIDGSAIDATADPKKTGAMFVTGLTVKGMTNKITMNLNATDENDNKCITSEPATSAATDAVFTLGDKATDGTIGDLTAKAPVYPHGDSKIPADDVNKNGTQIGESIMFLPNGASKSEIVFNIALTQYLKQTTNETVTPNTSKYDYKSQTADLKIKAASIKMNDSYTNATEFLPGYSYNVYITIYGFEEIVVTAELTPWEVGGDIDVDIEEEESQTPSGSQTPAETKNVAFNITDDSQNPVDGTITFGSESQVNTQSGSYTFTGLSKEERAYTVTADGYFTATGTVAADATSATVTLSQTKEVTFSISNEGADAAVISVKKTGEDQDLLNEGKATLTCGVEYVISVAAITGFDAYSETVEIAADQTDTYVITLTEDDQQG